MKLHLLCSLCAPIALCSTTFGEIIIDENLIDQMNSAGPREIISTLVYLDEQVDVKELSDSISHARMGFVERHKLVVETLQATAISTQTSIRAYLDTLGQKDKSLAVKPYWISNVIRVDAPPAVIRQLAEREDVGYIYLNYGIELVEPVRMGEVEQMDNRVGVEPGITAIRATEAWQMGFTGDGVLVATLDTGVDGGHEALASNWAGLRPEYAGHPEWAFLDPYTYNHNFPFDSGSHGTHTMGTVCGSAQGIGVAPDAHWITSAGIDRSSIGETVADAIETFQWFMDPDGNPATAWDFPRVCSNSWGLTSGHGYPNCDQTFWSYLDALEAAGCVVLFSAGNEGSSGLRRPGDRATDDYRTCAVAAIDPYSGSYPIASFSSRGPTNCTPDGSSAIKPDISGPGVDTYSSVPGGYTSMSGTSMASPHVNGAVALILQANPDLSVEEVKDILYTTALDLGATGEDNDYGHGLIDCVEAINMALETVSLSWNYPNGRPDRLNPIGGDEIQILISGNQATPNPTTATMHLIESDGTTEIPLTHDGGPNYHIIFPPTNCGDTIGYYFTIETTEGDTSNSPYNAPESTWSAISWAGNESTLLVENFDNGIPSDWTTSGLWNATTSCLPSGDCGDGNAAYYGDTGSCTYETGDTTTGSLLTPAIPIEDGTISITLSFCSALVTENLAGYDDADLYVNGVSVSSISESDNWQITEIDLSNVSGNTLQIEWRFDSVDNLYNDYRGWHVDNVVITAEALDCSSIPCTGDIDGDDTVGVGDVLAVIDQWGTNGSADINGDGIVDVSDMLMLVGNWGACE